MPFDADLLKAELLIWILRIVTNKLTSTSSRRMLVLLFGEPVGVGFV
jgi:hypothetical protein